MSLSYKKTLAFGFTILAIMASGCNTVQGVGQDLESAGEKAGEVTRKK